ncbi:MAG TPA: HD domain-containing phosphohydrolase [Phycisphaerae bacterium]|nr:HD domain-containing phosphohydrolase [Phycisphaerae bacterium]
MTPIRTSRSQVLCEMEAVFRSIRQRMAGLGVNFTVWDHEGRLFAGLEPACTFCRTVYEAASRCLLSIPALVAESAECDGPLWRELECGCCAMAIPLRRRRRIIGSVAACFPTNRWLDEEFLARQCDGMQMDRQVTAPLAEHACRRSPEEAQALLGLLTWLLGCEQSLLTAHEELETLSTNLTNTYEELSLLYSISGSMKVTQQPQDFLSQVCRELLEVMSISAAAAIIYEHPPATQEDILVVTGDLDLTPEQLKVLAATHVTRRVQRDKRPLVDNQFVWRTRPELARSVRNLMAVPLIADQPLGMLLAFNKNTGDFNSVDIKLMSSIGNQSAVFMANNLLYADLQDLLMGVLHALTATIDAKDPYTCGHSHRVAVISKRLAEDGKLPPEKVQQIYLAGLLHDIGKIGVPESTLCKPGRLTEEEYEEVKRHPGIGAKILGGIRQLDDILGGILCHHERLDGRGYPQGLQGGDVPLEARIIGLADCFDAMTSDRIYRKALPLEMVIGEIREHAGTQFDPKVVEQFLSLDLEAFLEELRRPASTVFPVAIGQEANE